MDFKLNADYEWMNEMFINVRKSTLAGADSN